MTQENAPLLHPPSNPFIPIPYTFKVVVNIHLPPPQVPPTSFHPTLSQHTLSSPPPCAPFPSSFPIILTALPQMLTWIPWNDSIFLWTPLFLTFFLILRHLPQIRSLSYSPDSSTSPIAISTHITCWLFIIDLLPVFLPQPQVHSMSSNQAMPITLSSFTNFRFTSFPSQYLAHCCRGRT